MPTSTRFPEPPPARLRSGPSRALIPVLAVALALLLPAGASAAQARPSESRAGAGAGREPFKELVFEPELVMRHQRDIGLTPEQREVFVREMQATHSDIVPMQVEMVEASADLLELLEPAAVDEQATLEAATRMMSLERQVKARRMTLLIRVKNLLTEEQQRRLRAIRDGGS